MKKYLNEENYQKGKKGLKTAGILVITLGILIGGFLIFNGISKNNENKKQQNQYEIEKQEKLLILKQELNQLEQEMEEMESNLRTSQNELQKIFSQDNGFSDRYYEQKEIVEQLSSDISKKNSEKIKKNSEIWKLENNFGNHFTNKNDGLFSILPGVFVIIASLMIGGSILLTAHQRNILAWQVQSVLPVAEETIETVTPTIKKVGEELSPLYGNIAKEITKGIKEGLKDDNK